MDTPLAKVLAWLPMTQKELGARCKLLQPTVSRLVTGSLPMSRNMAARIIKALDPDRRVISEVHLLYPEQFEGWRPGPNASIGERRGTVRQREAPTA